MLIRPITTEDVWQCTEICKRSGLLMACDSPPGLVALDGSRVVGFCLWGDVSGRSMQRLRQICVEPIERQKGIGRSLILEALQTLPTGMRLMIEVTRDQRELRTFLERCGIPFKRWPGDAGMTGYVWQKVASD